jgi:TPP-dependent pyruvate/acetoin dehydrogenase alpha subunit
MLHVLRSDGECDPKLEPSLSHDNLLNLYKFMILVRRLNERLLMLQRQGRIGFCVDSSGHEACQIGSAFALTKGDWLYPYYRDAGMCLVKGLPLKALMDHVFANAEDSSSIGRQLNVHWSSRENNIVSSSSCVASRLAHAVGTAYAMKYKNDKLVCLTTFGDGSTSQGEFHEAMNFAGVWKAPVIFLCENNHYAISTPERYQTASESIAIKAEAYGFEGVLVEGNDILAVYRATKAAVDKARSGEGPTLIEAVTYRHGGHSSSDDPSRYRSKEELDYWKGRDPIHLFQGYLTKKGLINEQEATKIAENVDSEISSAIRESEKSPKPALNTLFTDVYSEMPWHIKEELDEATKG